MLTRVLPLAVLAAALQVQAAEVPRYTIELNDGVINTRSITIPAGQRFSVEVVNKGKTPAEFESLSLGLELVVAPGSTRSRVLPGKSAGSYPFYDEFHMKSTKGVFIVK